MIKFRIYDWIFTLILLLCYYVWIFFPKFIIDYIYFQLLITSIVAFFYPLILRIFKLEISFSIGLVKIISILVVSQVINALTNLFVTQEIQRRGWTSLMLFGLLFIINIILLIISYSLGMMIGNCIKTGN